VPENIVNQFKKLTNNKVELAINLLDFEARFQPAIAHIFGQTFIAEDQETAKKVAMENNLGRKFNCVTLQGDSYRTDGILSGGAQQF
jgi:structural maintenance of chromosome 2